MDKVTEEAAKIGFAKVCIEFDLAVGFIDDFDLVFFNGEYVVVTVEYHWKPKFYEWCKKFGHLRSSYLCDPKRKKKVMGTKKKVTSSQQVVPADTWMKVIKGKDKKDSGQSSKEGKNTSSNNFKALGTLKEFEKANKFIVLALVTYKKTSSNKVSIDVEKSEKRMKEGSPGKHINLKGNAMFVSTQSQGLLRKVLILGDNLVSHDRKLVLNCDYLVKEYPPKALELAIQDPSTPFDEICPLPVASKNGSIIIIEVKIGEGVKFDEISMKKTIPGGMQQALNLETIEDGVSLAIMPFGKALKMDEKELLETKRQNLGKTNKKRSNKKGGKHPS